MQTRGEGVKKSQNFADVIYGWPLTRNGSEFGRERKREREREREKEREGGDFKLRASIGFVLGFDHENVTKIRQGGNVSLVKYSKKQQYVTDLYYLYNI